VEVGAAEIRVNQHDPTAGLTEGGGEIAGDD
jgi:hypothetical protein